MSLRRRPGPKRSVRAYRRMAEMGRKMWTKHGALDYKECVGDDFARRSPNRSLAS